MPNDSDPPPLPDDLPDPPPEFFEGKKSPYKNLKDKVDHHKTASLNRPRSDDPILIFPPPYIPPEDLPPMPGDGDEDDDNPVTGTELRDLKRLLVEQAKRKIDALNLYEPLPIQDDFHKADCRVRLLRGSNRSGKTLSSMVEVARATTGRDPYGKYPKTDGRCYIVGKDLKHIGEVIYPKLFRSGAFKIIRDAVTGAWRSYRPWQDGHRKKEAKPAPPLIPPRFLKKGGISWEQKSKNIIAKATLTTGWEIVFLSSLGKPPQGMDIDMCLAGDAEVYDPIARTVRRIDEIDGAFHVESYDVESGSVVIMPARRPFIKGRGELCEATLSNGGRLRTTLRHRVLTAANTWVELEEAWRHGMALAGVGPICDSVPGARVHVEENTYPRRVFSPEECIRSGRGPTAVPRREFVAGGSFENPPSCEASCALPDWQATGGSQCGYPSCLGFCDARPLAAQGGGRETAPSRVDARGRSPAEHVGETDCRSICIHMDHENDLFEGRFFALGAAPLSDKYQPSEVRRRCDYSSGEAVSQFDSTQDLGGTTRLLAADRRETTSASLADESAHRLPGATASVADSLCGNGSAANRLLADLGCNGEGVPRCLGAEKAACGSSQVYVVDVCKLGIGNIWDISVPKTQNYIYGGIVNHNCVFDEEIVDSEWYPEMSARLLDRDGRFHWSATPQAGTDRLYEIHLRCERELEDYRLKIGPAPDAREYVVLLADNPHIAEEQKKKLAADLDDQSYAVRIGGEFAILSSKVYPEFTKKQHIVPFFDIPASWTNYVAVDPGRQICAALFLTVPPKGDARDGSVYLFDELYIPDCDADKFGDQFATKIGNRQFEAFIIDNRMGRQTQISTGKTVEEHYSEALTKRSIGSRVTGSGFEWGSDDVAGGIEACRTWMRIQGAIGRPKLQVLEDKCDNFLWEIARYRYKRQNGMVIDEPETRGRVHLMATLRYLAMADPVWVEVGESKKKAKLSGAYAAFLAKKKRQQEAVGTAVIFGPRRGPQ